MVWPANLWDSKEAQRVSLEIVMPPVFGKESRLSKHIAWALPVEVPVFIGKYRVLDMI